MVRKLLLQFLLLALPFITYFIYVKLSRRTEKGESPWQGAPWFWLLSGGLALSIAGAVGLAVTSGSPPDARYVPSELQEGEIVPGRLE